ncbi:MAG: 3'-5' exonuclease [Patescibacteria group bacterium]|nr:3'-5' exonuclease [Patescibacteria group bacterium]
MANYKLYDVPMRDRDLAFIDTETTGLFLDKELLEIGVVRVDAKTLEIKSQADIKIKPSHIELADPEALRVVNFDSEEWERDGIPLREAVERFLDLVKDAILVGHNLAFDWMHIQNAIESCGLEPTYFYKGLDIFSIAWVKFIEDPFLEKMSLKEMANYFGIEIEHHHRAIDDALATYRIFTKLIEKPES